MSSMLALQRLKAHASRSSPKSAGGRLIRTIVIEGDWVISGVYKGGCMGCVSPLPLLTQSRAGVSGVVAKYASNQQNVINIAMAIRTVKITMKKSFTLATFYVVECEVQVSRRLLAAL
jgi:hypothetical protein